MDKKQMLDDFIHRCRERNLKVTPQRLAIYEEVISEKSHPSADSIFQKVREKMPYLSFNTVNQNLITFSDYGIIDVVEGYGNPRRYDPDTHPHHHFWCVACNSISDVYDVDLDIALPESMIQSSRIVYKTKVVFEGLCEVCQSENEEG